MKVNSDSKLGKRISVTIKPTNACNMRCRHCYHAEEGYEEGFLDIDFARKFFDIAIKEYNEIMVVFHGGEPMLWGLDNFSSLIEYQNLILKRNPFLKIRNSIQTNGTLITEKWITFFKENNFSVGISFDGPHNDVLRYHTDVVFNNMRKMHESKLNFGVLCVEGQKTINELKKTYDWFNRHGFNYKVLALFMSGEAKKYKEFELDIDDYVKNLTDLYQFWLTDQNCKISMRTFEDFLKISDRFYCIQYGGSCIHNRICLNPNGDIYPCGRPYTKDFILGNIESLNMISEAFDSPAYKKLVKISAQRVEQCQKKCDFFGICKGGCVSSAILEGSFEKIDNVTCVRAKKLLSIVTKINKQIYSQFDRGDISHINPRALTIIEKSRQNKFDFMKQ